MVARDQRMRETPPTEHTDRSIHFARREYLSWHSLVTGCAAPTRPNHQPQPARHSRSSGMPMRVASARNTTVTKRSRRRFIFRLNARRRPRLASTRRRSPHGGGNPTTGTPTTGTPITSTPTTARLRVAQASTQLRPWLGIILATQLVAVDMHPMKTQQQHTQRKSV